MALGLGITTELLEKPVIVDIIETFDGVLIDASIRHEDPQIDQS